MQFGVLLLLAVSVIVTVAHENNGCPLLEPCRRHIGVYYFITKLPLNLTVYLVATYHADGSFNLIETVSDGNPQISSTGTSTNPNGVWECDGPNIMIATEFIFYHATQTTPGSIAKGVSKMEFDESGRASGTYASSIYDLASTIIPDQSQWTKLAGLFQVNVTGYKLFNICGHKRS